MNRYEMYCTCGELRFYVKEKAYIGDIVVASNIIHTDGSEPKAGDVVPPCLGCDKKYIDIDPTSAGVKGAKYE